jgi:L-iditol 2-dehydrogenase
VEDGVRAGERVAVDPADACGRCDLCRTGQGRLCRSIRFAGLAPHDGALQTWLAWPGSRCFAVPDSISDAEVTLLEVAGIALHATELGEFQPGMSAGVYGAGPIGQLVIRALRAMGASRIVASDRLAHRVDAARVSGADEAIVVEEGSADGAADIPVDIAFECAGSDAAIDTAVRAVRPGGTVLLLGIPSTASSTFPASPARRKEVRLQSVRRMEGNDLPLAIDLVASGRLSLAGLVTARYPFEQAGAAFETAIERQGLKTVILL